MEQQNPLSAWFLGPRAENAAVWAELFDHIAQDYIHWRRNYFPADPVIVGRTRRRSPEHEAWLDRLTGELDGVLSELKYHFPLHSPRYNAHMVSEQSLPAVLGWFAGLLYNPNNVSGESAPITVSLELEVGRMIAAMLGYDPRRAWAHLCSGGTVATLEALWVARSAQFGPLIARDLCRAHDLPLRIRTPSGAEAPIALLDERTLLAMRPQETVPLFRTLSRLLHERTGLPSDAIVARLDEAVEQSPWNVVRRGLGPVLARLGLRPVVFASAAAHYSIAKACNVLGYGEDGLRLIPVNDRFQIDLGALEEGLERLAPDEYVAAVIGIVGTTEEGAVDPVHRLVALRTGRERTRDRSFWLHLDAAWGGYLRALFRGLALPGLAPGAGLAETGAAAASALDLHEQVELDIGVGQRDVRTLDVRWGDSETCAAFLAIAEADSTTIDPHKMGYVPYPAGVIAFRNGVAAEFITQRAQYLGDEAEGIGSFSDPAAVTAFGPHTLEGSKPGAAALACYLAHRTIPLDTMGHGQIVRVTLLAARRLHCFLANHALLFRRLEAERAPDAPPAAPFTFVPIAEPETNLVCFVARPMMWVEGGMVPAPVPLEAINAFNERIYAAASIPGSRAPHRLSAGQPFFISRTRFEERQYRGDTLGPLLARLSLSRDDYARHGLFVLRSTVMNPWHGEARRAGMDYLFEFVRFLHRVGAEALSGTAPSPSPAVSSAGFQT